MPITANSARAYHGLQATAEPSSEGTSGTVIIGQGQTVTTLAAVNYAVVLAVELDSTYTVAVDLSNLLPTLTGAGVNQVETATAAGTITGTGNATVIVTGDDIAGSPLTISVAVANTDTAATWAGKVRTALNATAAITSLYTVGGATTAITLTRTAARYNDTTLNISLDNGTCTGITPALISTGTTEGVNPAKCWRISGSTYAGEDFEGVDFSPVATYAAFQIRQTAGLGLVLLDSPGLMSDTIEAGGGLQRWNSAGLYLACLDTMGTLTLTGSGGYSKCIVTFTFDTV